MSTAALREFVTKTAAKKRITFGDVRRLQRNILPNGVFEREQVSLLLTLDRDVARADNAWTKWLVAAIVDFAVWGERPTGSVEGEPARWLKDELTREGLLTRVGRRIAREIRCETDRVDAGIEALAPDEPEQLRFEQAAELLDGQLGRDAVRWRHGTQNIVGGSLDAPTGEGGFLSR